MARKPDPALRVRILEQAEHLIHLKGYRDTSLDEIAAACAMTKANLIHHFRSKEELGLAVLDYKMRLQRCGCVEPFLCCEEPGRAVSKLFADAARFFRGNGCRAGCFVGNIALEMCDVSERFRERAALFFKEWTQALEAALRRAQRAGKASRALDPRAAAETILALYEGAIMLARTRRDPGVFGRVAREARAFVAAPPPGRNDRRKTAKGGR